MKRNNEDPKKKVDQAIEDEDFDDLSKLVEDTVETAIDLVKGGIYNFRDFVGKNTQTPSIKRESVVVQKNPIISDAKRKAFFGNILTGIGVLFFISTLVDFEILSLVLLALSLSYGGKLREEAKALRKKAFRFDRYKKELSYVPVMSVQALADQVGEKPSLVRRELDEYITKDYFKQGRLIRDKSLFVLDSQAYSKYIDDEYTDLIRGAVYDQYKEELEKEKNKRQESSVDETIDHIQIEEDQAREEESAQASLKEYINDLDRISANLDGPIKGSVDRLISTIGSIHYHLKNDPSAASSARKFLDYYVPTVIKLLNSYIGFSKIPSPGANTSHAMAEIEKSMDTINSAFEKFLDDLFEDSRVDISSDISVLKTMMKQDGLLEDDFKI